MRKETIRLNKLYRELNRKYFHSRLPKKLHLEFQHSDDWLGRTVSFRVYEEIGKRLPDEVGIQINSDIRDYENLVRGTLIHEMVHLELPQRFGHGPRFQRRMLQLAKAGALKGVW